MNDKRFLGPEFLSWLWYRAEVDPVFEYSSGRRCEIELMGPILLEAEFGDARASALRGESPGTSPEATTALLQGKKLRRARFRLHAGEVDWVATLEAETLSFSGLNVPRAGPLPLEEALRLRLEFVLEFEAVLGELLDRFLATRLDAAAWAEELGRLRAWIAGR